MKPRRPPPGLHALPPPGRASGRFHDLVLSVVYGSRRVVPVRLAGKAYAGYRSGGHLSPEHAVGTVTFEEFLARRHRRAGGLSAGG
ncbi:hypothetical protein [Streptomyces sp. CA-146814]|uniref:hypothetical protein n=1 Tax=Streptomyces sp. CA-146814 TaxID=3240053 RepID=UPI003D8E9635